MGTFGRNATRARVAMGCVCLALGLGSATAAAQTDAPQETTLGFERFDLIDDGGAGWINYELPSIGARGDRAAYRWLTQVQLVLRTWWRGFNIGVSLDAISFQYEARVTGVVAAFAGVHTATLLPRGATIGWALRLGPIRVAVGVAVNSTTRWSDPHWTVWSVLPVVGIGIGRTDPSLAEL